MSINETYNASNEAATGSKDAFQAHEEAYPYNILLRPYDDPRPSIYPYNPLNPYTDLTSKYEFVRERSEKHIELYHELINSGASYEAANKLIDLLTDFYIKDWIAREREWILVEKIRELTKTDPLYVALMKLEL